MGLSQFDGTYPPYRFSEPGRGAKPNLGEGSDQHRRQLIQCRLEQKIVALCQLLDDAVASVCREYELGRGRGAPLGPPEPGRRRRGAGVSTAATEELSPRLRRATPATSPKTSDILAVLSVASPRNTMTARTQAFRRAEEGRGGSATSAKACDCSSCPVPPCSEPLGPRPSTEGLRAPRVIEEVRGR